MQLQVPGFSDDEVSLPKIRIGICAMDKKVWSLAPQVEVRVYAIDKATRYNSSHSAVQ